MNIILCKRNFTPITILTYAIISAVQYKCKGNCLLSVNSAKAPIPYKKVGSNYEIIYPNSDGNLELQYGTLFHLSCTDNQLVIKTLMYLKVSDVDVHCNGGNDVLFNDSSYSFHDFLCKETLKSTLVVTDNKCAPNAIVSYVGFQTKNAFLTQYGICFDKKEMNSLYSWYEGRVPYINKNHTYNAKPNFQKADSKLYNDINVNNAYEVEVQKKTISTILRSQTNADNFIKNDNKHVLTRGHLSHKGGFFYAFERIATFRYENMTPQWGTLNSGIWRNVEDEIQNKLKNKIPKERVIIVTGSYKSCMLPDFNNKLKPIYLAAENKIPVPMYIWKLYYNLNTEENIVFIGLNNPYEKSINSTYFCKNECPGKFNDNVIGTSSNSGSSRFNNQSLVFCCTLDNFRKSYKKLSNVVFTPFQ